MLLRVLMIEPDAIHHIQVTGGWLFLWEHAPVTSAACIIHRVEFPGISAAAQGQTTDSQQRECCGGRFRDLQGMDAVFCVDKLDGIIGEGAACEGEVE